MPSLQLDPILLEAVIRGTTEGLSMTGLQPPPVGASRFYTASRPISVIVGMVGKTNGTCSISMSERALLHVADALLSEQRTSVDHEVIDAIGEVGNMIAGRVKDLLTGTHFEMENISVPSVIIGASYALHFARGMHVVSVDFELADLPVCDAKDRFITVTLSLLRRVSVAA
ncbi:MAG: chemotaxis protein CheX [Planctomycetes bacterium]|nr:chemotaxis protein CheX [Planctomycetota bacterium]